MLMLVPKEEGRRTGKAAAGVGCKKQKLAD